MRKTLLAILTTGFLTLTTTAEELKPIAAAEDAAVGSKALMVKEAATALGNLEPGQHKLLFVHPHTCCEVEVCVCLPCGCYCVKDGCDKIRFKIKGAKDVVVKFKRNGKTKVS